MRRIAFVIPTLDRGGAEKQLTILARALPEHGFEPTVLVLTRSGPYEEMLRAAGITVLQIGKKLKADPLCWLRLRQALRAGQYALVHTWLFAGNSYGRLAAWSLRFRPVVATERCADYWKGPLHFWLDRLLLRVTDRIVVNSRGVWEFYRDVVGVPEEKLVLIRNAVPDAPLPFVSRAGKLQSLGIPPQSYVVGFVGRLWPQKRVRDLIWACDIVRNIKPNIRLLIVGDGPLRRDLERYAWDVGMGERTLFLGERADIAELLQVMDVLVLPSAFEGMPNAVLEAMAAGVPVVASAIAGTREVVQDGHTGFLVPLGDRAALAKRINHLLEQPQLRRRMGEAGRAYVRQHFTVERMVSAHVRLYMELLYRPDSGVPVWEKAYRKLRNRELGTRPIPAGGIRAALW